MTEQAAEGTSAAASDSTGLTLSQGQGGILGIKAGMTTLYNKSKERVSVTVVDLPKCVVTQVKTKDKDGYQAVQVGFLDRKKVRNKPEAGRLKAIANKNGFYHYKEFRIPDGSSLDGVAVGAVLSPEFVQVGDFVDVTSVSKGKGFQGVMKRYNFAGGFKSHGASVCHRSLGSIGNRADPGKVFKNRKMAGRMGNRNVTIQNLEVISVDAAKGLLVLKGPVPGPRASLLTIRRAIKGINQKKKSKA